MFATLAADYPRDPRPGEPAIGVPEEVGLSGPRLAGIVGGQAGEQ